MEDTSWLGVSESEIGKPGGSGSVRVGEHGGEVGVEGVGDNISVGDSISGGCGSNDE